VKPFYYRIDAQGRLHVPGAFPVDSIPPPEWTSRFVQGTGLALESKIIPVQESNASPSIEALWRPRPYQPSRN